MADKMTMDEKPVLKILTLEQIKAQLRLEPDDNSEDSELLLYGLASEQAVSNHINRNLYHVMPPEIDDPTGMLVTHNIIVAMLLMVGQLYENREATSERTIKEVPIAYSYLLEKYRVIPV